jgi:phosphate starvation-inducible PhoH-like protein
MFLTRMGPTAKVMVNGDRSQIDLPTRQKSGLMQALDILKDVPGIGFVEMTAEDVVRHRLVKEIVQAYDRFDTEEQRRQGQQQGTTRRDERHERRLLDLQNQQEQPESDLPVNQEHAL